MISSICGNFRQKFSKLFKKKKESAEERILLDEIEQDDDDIVALKRELEDEQTLAERIKSKPLVLSKVSKKYVGGLEAVREVSFYLEQSECFGLLGPNGAGKTSTFKMLTGEHEITAGRAFINRKNVATERQKSRQQFGYCPQFDALLEQLTAKETLVMYSRLRGVPVEEMESSISALLTLLGIEKFENEKVLGFSGGTKRKLSVAIAMVGYPAVLILDEPSCGLDPGARRQLWHVIKCIQRAETAILLTSHSMEECAALCDRLAILVAGKLKCIGG